MKKILILITFVLGAWGCHAETMTNLVITYHTGNTTILALDTRPVLTFEGEDLVVTDTSSTISIPIADIKDYRFVESTDIDEKSTPALFANGHVIITSLPESTPAYVHTVGGMVVMERHADAQGTADIDLGALQSGIYIISTRTSHIKVTKK